MRTTGTPDTDATLTSSHSAGAVGGAAAGSDASAAASAAAEAERIGLKTAAEMIERLPGRLRDSGVVGDARYVLSLSVFIVAFGYLCVTHRRRGCQPCLSQGQLRRAPHHSPPR